MLPVEVGLSQLWAGLMVLVTPVQAAFRASQSALQVDSALRRVDEVPGLIVKQTMPPA
jgi:hypothetical protein